MKKLTILCDLDGIVADLLGEWIRRANELHGTDIKLEQVDRWDIHECVPMGHAIYKLLTPSLFAAIKPVPGAVEALKSFHDAGHDVTIVTASASDPGTAAAKIAWVREYLPWMDRKDVFIGHKKHLIRGDVLIDDSPENILAYRKAWPDAQIVTIAYPYNAEVRFVTNFRAHSHQHFASAWSSIRSYVDALAWEQL